MGIWSVVSIKTKIRGSYRGYKCLSYEHTKDICKSNRLSWSLFGPQGLDIVGDVLGHQQPKWVTANSLHQLTVDVLRALIWKVRVGVESWHVPAGVKREKVNTDAMSVNTCFNNIPLYEVYAGTLLVRKLNPLSRGDRNKPEVPAWRLHTSRGRVESLPEQGGATPRKN